MDTINSHTYATISPLRFTGDPVIDDEPIEQMLAKQQKDPSIRWAVEQCLALDSCNAGDIRFIAVGPNCTNKCLESTTMSHWSKHFVGWVDLKNKRIVSVMPE